MDFYNLQINNFKDVEKRDESITLINSTSEGVKKIDYLRLFK